MSSSNVFFILTRRKFKMEDELDYILSQVDAHLFDHALTDIFASDSAVPSALPNGKRFAFQSDESVEAEKTNSVPKNTSRNTNWAVKVWKDWSSHRRTTFPNSLFIFILLNLFMNYHY